MGSSDGPYTFQIPSLRGNDAHISRYRLHDDSGDAIRVLVEELLYRLQVIVGQDKGIGHAGCRDAGRVGEAEGGHAGTGLYEKQVGMAVVVARKLDNLISPGEGAGQPEGAHRRLGAGIDETNHFDAWHEVHDQACQVQFERTRCAEAGALLRGFSQGFRYTLGRVSEDQRAEGEHVIDVPIVVHVDQVGALAAIDKQRLAADGVEGARR